MDVFRHAGLIGGLIDELRTIYNDDISYDTFDTEHRHRIDSINDLFDSQSVAQFHSKIVQLQRDQEENYFKWYMSDNVDLFIEVSKMIDVKNKFHYAFAYYVQLIPTTSYKYDVVKTCLQYIIELYKKESLDDFVPIKYGQWYYDNIKTGVVKFISISDNWADISYILKGCGNCNDETEYCEYCTICGPLHVNEILLNRFVNDKLSNDLALQLSVYLCKFYCINKFFSKVFIDFICITVKCKYHELVNDVSLLCAIYMTKFDIRAQDIF